METVVLEKQCLSDIDMKEDDKYYIAFDCYAWNVGKASNDDNS